MWDCTFSADSEYLVSGLCFIIGGVDPSQLLPTTPHVSGIYLTERPFDNIWATTRPPFVSPLVTSVFKFKSKNTLFPCSMLDRDGGSINPTNSFVALKDLHFILNKLESVTLANLTDVDVDASSFHILITAQGVGT